MAAPASLPIWLGHPNDATGILQLGKLWAELKNAIEQEDGDPGRVPDDVVQNAIVETCTKSGGAWNGRHSGHLGVVKCCRKADGRPKALSNLQTFANSRNPDTQPAGQPNWRDWRDIIMVGNTQKPLLRCLRIAKHGHRT